jgi:acetyl esterase
MLDPDFKALLEAEAAAAAAAPDTPPMEALPPEVLRAFYQQLRISQNVRTSPKDVEARDLQVDGAQGPIPARLYTPAAAQTPGPCLVYFHGGGWVIGDLETHDGHCRRLAAFSGARVLAVDYRLAPEFPFPAGHDDALAATKWAFDHAAGLGVDPARIGVGGDSAGGNLAAAVALDLRGDSQRRLKFQLLLYPATSPVAPTKSRRERDGPVLTTGVMDWFEKCLAAAGHPEGLRAMPGRQSRLANLPPAFVATAGFDPLEDEGRDYARALIAAGGLAEHADHPTLVHDFYVMGDISPAVIEAARRAGAAIRAAL